MANRKINELSVRTPSLTDLMIVGDPSTGYSFKATLAALNTLIDSSTSIGDLNGVVITSPTNGQALVYDGTNWVNQSISVPVTSIFGRTGAVVATEGDYSLDLLSDVTLTTPSSNQVLQYNGTAWVNATLTDNGITSLNGLTALSQTFATGTSGTDFAISSTTSTHTFNLPTASAVNRGALSSADWSTFNAKQDALSLTTTGNSGSATLVGATLNVPTYTLAGLGGITLSSLSASAPLSYNNGTGAFSISQASGSTNGFLSSTDWNTFNNKQNALTNPVTGTGTTNYLPKWTSSSALGNSLVYDDGTSVGIGTTSPGRLLQVNGTVQLGTPVVGASAASSTVIIDRQSNTNNLVLSSGNGDNSIRFRNYVETVLGQINFSSTGLGLGTNGNSQDLIIFRTTNRVGIGTTVDAGYRLDVSGTFRSTLDANINGLTVGKGGGSVASNTAFGISVISGSATGTQNVGVGNTALRDLSSGSSNTAVGQAAGRANTTAANNAYFGFAAGIVNTTGGNNTALGTYSGYSMTGSNNTYVGYFSGGDITTGGNNTIIGQNTGRGITTGNNNTIIGAGVTGLSSSLSNTIILADGQGNQRLYINSSGNVGIGTTSPNASAILELSSTTKALLLPRMTGAQAEAIAGVDGLVIYANNGNGTTITSTGFWGYAAGAWVKLN